MFARSTFRPLAVLTKSLQPIASTSSVLSPVSSSSSARALSSARARVTANAQGQTPSVLSRCTSGRKDGLNQSVGKRAFSGTSARLHGDLTRPSPPGSGIPITFRDAKGEVVTHVEGNEGDDLLGLAHEWGVELEGACEGSIACSTCHVILDPESYDKLPEPEDDENDMLDLAFGLTDTSRLGCQVKLTKEMAGMTATLPSATRNMYVDGHKPTPH